MMGTAGLKDHPIVDIAGAVAYGHDRAASERWMTE